MNGFCRGGSCQCDKGWKGTSCNLLDLKPLSTPIQGAYGYSPNVTSWGGNPIFVDGQYHLYVAEMVNHCGLCNWIQNSRVIHATSNDLFGPYKFSEQALGVWAHNPQVVVDNSTKPEVYLLFHIGTGEGGNPVRCGNNDFPSSNEEFNYPEYLASGVLHSASSPNGPWTPQNPPGLGGCNNPAPYVFANGSIVVTCTWNSYKAQSWKGPWTRVNFNFHGDAGAGTWEDPFIWYDYRHNVWKLLSHVYPSGGNYWDRVAGYGYSPDGSNWTRFPSQPYDHLVALSNGQTLALTTRERPKIFFDKDGVTPLALFNGVQSLQGGSKFVCGKDWTWTMAQPFN
jgi:hypothetical protein